MDWSTVSVLAPLVLLLWGSGARAQVVYDNGPPESGFMSNGAYALTETVQAEDFSLSAPATVTGLRFHALERGARYAGSVYWSIRPDEGGRPGDAAIAGGVTDAVTRTPTGVVRNDHFNAPQSLYAVEVGTVALAPGDYWLLLHNGPLTLDDPDDARGFLLWESTAGPRGLPGREDPAPFDGAWEPSSTTPIRERSFSLVTVPEPTAGLGLAAAGVLLFRRPKGRFRR